MAVVAMKQLLEAGVHFGHQTRRWDPKMAEYIFQARNGIHIIDLQKTSKKLDEAYKFVKEQAEEGKSILFVGTKKQAQECIKEAALKCNMYYVDQRWLGGMLTNHKTIKWYKEVVNAIPNPDPEHPSWGIASLDPNDGLDDYFTPTLWTADGMAWMFRPYDNCPTKGGWVLVDTNGAKQPNTRGIDIHVFLVGHRTCKSAGFGVYAAGDGCNAPNSHYACTVYAVTEGKMPWFREPGRYTGCAPFQQSEQKCPRFE